MKKKILIEGWRYINHSYALVNQFQIKELIKNKNLDIYFFDVPYFNPNWNKSDNHSGFDNYDFLKNLKKPNPNSNFDLIYRISYPPNLSGGNAKQIFVFGNSEFQNLDGIVGKKNIDNSKNINEKIKIIVPSNWSKKGFLSFGIPENKIFVIPHGVNQEIFKPISDSEKKKLERNIIFQEIILFFLIWVQ
jgi:glycosyltransferase involved in cell wall biosynthesis